jgi:hypothetical protein
MRRHTQPRRKAPGNDGTAWHTRRPATGISGLPGVCFRRTRD